MGMNKPTLIATVALVFVVGLVFGSFSGLTNVATGQYSREVSTASVTVYDKTVRVREDVTGAVSPGRNGAEKSLYIYAVQGGRLTVRVDRCQSCFCQHNNICYDPETFRYQVPATLAPGKYAAAVKDYGTQAWQYDTFEVV